mgnify:CR=1 FL=1
MDAKSTSRRLRISLVALVAILALFFLSAPAMAGRLLGDLWVTTMAAVMGLIGNLLGG